MFHCIHKVFFSADEIRRREASARRRSSSVLVDGKGPKPAQRSAEDKQERGRKHSISAIDGKARLPGSPKPTRRSAEDKQERSRKSSVSKIPSPRHKPEQPVTSASRKMSTESTVHRSLPSTPRERKSSTIQNGAKSNAVKGPKTSAVTEKTKGQQTPPTSRRENKSVIKKKGLTDTKANKNVGKERSTKIGHEDEKRKVLNNEQIKDDVLNICDISISDDSVSNGQLNGKSENLSQNSDTIDDISSTRDITSPDGRFSPKLTMYEGRKTSECSLETDSDVNSDLLSDMTDTDYDFRSQRYSGLSETSSDISFSTSPAWKLFHSAELDKNVPEPDNSELGSSLKDCLKNLNLQGSVTPTMKRRIFDAPPTRNPREESPDLVMASETPPVDKAVFFDIEHYNDKSPEEEDAIVGSPRKWSLVKSLVSSIEKRSGSSAASSRASKNAAAVSRGSAPGTARKHHGMDESAATTQKTMSNQEMPRTRRPPFNGHTEVKEIIVKNPIYIFALELIRSFHS